MNFFSARLKGKTSDYNLRVDCDEGQLLYNQISGALALLNPSQIPLYDQMIEGKKVPRSFLSDMTNSGFVVKKSVDEIQWMNSKADDVANNRESKSITIAVTDRCNLDCVYCYEAKDQWILMSDETVEDMERFGERFITSTPTKSLGIIWFGGEPTLHMGAIERLSKFFAAKCNYSGIQYSQTMITNGTTLNSKMIERLSKIGCKTLQITVDGDKSSHDAKRPFRQVSLPQIKTTKSSCGTCGESSGEHASSFDKIVGNLKPLYDAGFRVKLRINIDHKNLDAPVHIKKMLSDMGMAGQSSNGGGIYVYSSPVFGGQSDDLNREEFSLIDLKNKKEDKHQALLKSFTGQTCMAGTRYSLAVSQNGKLNKCWHYTTDEHHTVGTIKDLSIAEEGYLDKYSPANDPVCSKCEVLPTCWGGCRQLNNYWPEGSSGKKYEGCDTMRWNIKGRVLALYQNQTLQSAS